MSSTLAHKSSGHARKLLLLTSDPAEEALLSKHLQREEQGKYVLSLVGSLEELKKIGIESNCDAVLLDIRTGDHEVMESIQWFGDRQSPVALICLCRSHEQLSNYKAQIHLIDDYILADTLPQGELTTRISHAIRRRIKEHELLHEQRLLQSLLENIPDAIYFKDLESRFTKVNQAMARSYGFDQKEIIGRNDFDIFTEEHARPAYEDEQKIIRTGESIVGKIEKETLADGEIRWASTTKVPLKDIHGSIIGTMGISRNITELKKAQDGLSEEQALLKTIVNHALAGIFYKGLDGRYLLVNKRHSDYLGASDPQAVLGKTIYDFFSADFAAKIDQADKEIMRFKKGIEGMVDHRRAIGKKDRWLLTSKVPLVDESGQCKGLVGISIDLTQQKENELALKQALETLKETQLQLIEAEKLKTVGRLSAGVAHEVKNPLNVVSLGAEYLLTQIDGPEELVEIVNDMKHAVEKANAVILQLLDYSSPHEVTTGPNDLNAVIKEVLSMLRHNFNKAHVEVETDLDPDLPAVSLDTQKMDQVFINLFLNAIAAMKKGGRLNIRTYTQRMKSTGSNVSGEMTELFQVGERIVTVEITDTGQGIPDKALDKLFDPFYSTKVTGEGTGLGLSVTRSIVEMHRGMINLQNRKDTSGACATLHFPISPETHA